MVRKVRTQEGSRYYDLPIGAPITAEAKAKAKARSGAAGRAKGDRIAAQKGGGSAAAAAPAPTRPAILPPKRPKAGLAAPTPTSSARTGAAPKPAAADKPKPKPMPKRKFTPPKPAAEGAETVKVGTLDYEVPPGSETFERPNSPVKYNLDSDGNLKVMTPRGEATLSDDEASKVRELLDVDQDEFDVVEHAMPPEDSAPESSSKPADKPAADAPADKPAADSAPASSDKPKGPLDLGPGAGKGKWNETSMGESVPAPDPEEVAAMQSSPYTSKHLNPDGSFTEERKKLHDQIIESFLEGLKPQENPTQFMNGGGPASGKGTMTTGQNKKLTNYPPSRHIDDLTGEFLPDETPPEAVLIDPDAIKLQFPEVKEARGKIMTAKADPNAAEPSEDDKQWAGKIHEESSQLAKRLHRAALERGYNIIYDGTGNGSVKSVKSKLQAARDLGFRVEANYLYLDPQEGVKRAKIRSERANRIVPEKAITGTYAALPPIFDELAKEGLFDKIQLFDNNHPREVGAKLIGTGGPDGFEILDEEAYTNFMTSADTFKQEAIQKDLNTTRSAKEAQK